jgi:Flp pilus assembly protein TadG
MPFCVEVQRSIASGHVEGFMTVRANTSQTARLNRLGSDVGRRNAQVRRGVVMAETAIILSVFLLLILGAFDLGIATYRFNMLSQAARQGARQGMVHGSLAPPVMAAWGPGTYSGTAGDGSVYAQAVSPMLVGFDLTKVNIQVAWPDGGNALQQRVQYTVTMTYKPIVTSFFTSASYPLSAVSAMPIAH